MCWQGGALHHHGELCGPAVSIPQEPPTSREADLPPIQKEDLDRAGEAAREVVGRVLVLEQELQQMGLVVTNGSKESLHRAFFRSGNPELRDVNRNGMVVVEATQQLMRQFHLNNLQGRDGLPKISVRETVINDSCPIPPPCPSTKYRTVDGSCNNLKRPQWGKAFTAFQRLLPPDYADGVNLPRVSVDNGPLPSSRDVSGFVVEDRDRPNPVLNLVLMQWGQFLDHDLTLTGVSSDTKPIYLEKCKLFKRINENKGYIEVNSVAADNGEGIICCNPEIIQNPRLRHPACFPIGMGPSDPFFAQFQQSCMEFVRSVPAPTMECSFGPRQQINQITSFIDASNVYGSSDAELNALRSFRQGDSRVNEQTSLAVMHTIWLREHNRIAGELSNLNPGWTDEILFQETRRIIIAMMQHITYNEYLPLIVGRRIMKSFNMDLKPRGYKRNYDTSINPTILNVFATAAYRFGHSLVQGLVALVESDGSVNEEVQLFTQLFNPEMLSREGYVDRFLRGLVVQPVQRFDHFLTTQVTHHLFQATGETFGLDLASLNIQRGRDHGLPGYNAWRRACGLKPAQSFEELAEFLHPEAVEKFRLLYRQVLRVWISAIGFCRGNSHLGKL
ncbi:hypothetical protein LAZ67_20000683 [Cordylochernes scorpioides]|uniref:Uncharacterized protein n=1 Tax=Cordylochernes scorpioides TaxID=51811 RepID=A0ABY6LJ97_9ARAC|nr:hypothetical protein LAZ67_20000683 [Cordylochernes scorpioides]